MNETAADMIRLYVSRRNGELQPGDMIEIGSCITKTSVVFPVEDLEMLIRSLERIRCMSSKPETICLDPSSGICVSGRSASRPSTPDHR